MSLQGALRGVSPLEGVARHRREVVVLGRYPLPGALLIAPDVGIEEGVLRIFGSVEVHHQAVRLQALDERVDLRERDLRIGDPAPGSVPAVEHDGIDRSIAGEELPQLGLDECCLFGGEGQRVANPVMRVQDGEMEHHLHPGLPEGGGEFFQHVPSERCVHHAVIGGSRVPHAESRVVFHAHADERAPGALRRFHPLPGVQLSRVEYGRIQVGIGPVGLLERGKPEMDEHSQAEVHELLLQLMQTLLLRRQSQRKRHQDEKKNAMCPVCPHKAKIMLSA